jgi:hypothetical protein
MANENSSVVSIVGILAIVLIVGVAIYLFMMAGGGDDADIQIDFGASPVGLEASTFAARDAAPPAGAAIRFSA